MDFQSKVEREAKRELNSSGRDRPITGQRYAKKTLVKIGALELTEAMMTTGKVATQKTSRLEKRILKAF